MKIPEDTMPPGKTDDFVRTFGEAGRSLSNATVAFHQAVAEHLGLHITDHKALGILQDRGAMPAGQLGELLGLSTGAVTALLDRLEEAGYVERQRDPADRRKVLAAPVGNARRDARIRRPFDRMTESFAKHLPDYTDRETKLILDFIQRSVTALQEATERVRAD